MNLAKEQIARQFSRAATSYDAAAPLQNKMAQRLIAAIPHESTGTLVDLGCGTGWALQQIANQFALELIAVDLAPGMIEFAQARVPKAQFHCGDLEETPLESELADFVFSNAAIQWCDADSAVMEIARLCKPGGQVMLSTFGPGTCGEIREAWKQSGDDVTRVHEFVSQDELKARLSTVGFKNIQLQSELSHVQFRDVDELLQSIKQIGATNASRTRQTGLLGANRYRAFCRELEKQLTEYGELSLTFNCIFAFATK